MPWTSKVVLGVVVKMPTRLFVESIESVLVSKDSPLTPPDKVRLVSLANVHASALAITVSPLASPKTVLPFTRRSVPVVMEPVAWTPLDTSNPPKNEDDPVPFTLKFDEILAVPITSRVAEMDTPESNLDLPSTSKAPESKRSLEVERKEPVVVFVPNLEYAADEKPPTWRVLPVRR